MDVRSFRETPSYYGTQNQAGNVEEYTEGETRGGDWQGNTLNSRYPQMRMASLSPITFGSVDGVTGFRIATGPNAPAGGLRNGDKIRFYPRPGYNNRMVGGVFEAGSRVLHTVTETPPDGWTEVSVDFGEDSRFRYRAPDGGYGNVAEIEFCRRGAKVFAAESGTSGSWSGKDKDTFRAALDGDPSTFFDAPEPNGAYVEVDTGQGTPFLHVPAMNS
jgi:hypothetical protein